MPKVESSLKLCAVCKEYEAKYRCPACDIKTCTLTCVQKHKLKKQCPGIIKSPDRFIPMQSFTAEDITQDYQFLESAIRAADNAHRDSPKQQRKPIVYLDKLQKRAKSLNIDLKLMPFPMTRRKINKTRILNMSSPDATIDWMVEWIFPQADMKDIKQNIPFTTPVSEALQKHIHPSESDPVVRFALKRYVAAGIEGLGVYMKAEGVPANQKKYHRFDPSKTVTENLCGKLVVEFPTVYAVLKEDSKRYEDNCVTESDEESSSGSSEDSSEEESSSEEEEETEADKSSDKIRIAGIPVE